ncbi:MAG: ABC transporter permease [Oscillospiraceae bacterium]|jgi:ribose transport system permease protein|nr:ABC transporter permease [Oscillospiraceae bacterium]
MKLLPTKKTGPAPQGNGAMTPIEMEMERTKRKLSPTAKQYLTTVSALVVLIVVFTIINNRFIASQNILNIVFQTTPIIIIAMGQTYVLITGGIDLTIGSNIAFAAMVSCLLMGGGLPFFAAIPIGMLIGVTVGAINGALITYGKLPPFIATMGTMSAVRGAAQIITNGMPVASGNALFQAIGQKRSFLSIPNSIYPMIVLVIIFGFILAKTRSGRYIYAYGSNYEATRLSGVNTNATILKAYVVSGFLSVCAGLLIAAKLDSAAPTAGDGYELDAVAASVIGGASTMGGEGTIFGTFLGALVIGVLRNGLNLASINTNYQKIVIGAVILAAVFVDKRRKK